MTNTTQTLEQIAELTKDAEHHLQIANSESCSLHKAGYYEGAASLYKRAGMLEEAGRANTRCRE